MEFTNHLLQSYPWAIDLALFFFFFASASRVAYAKSFPGREGRMLAASTGLVLAAGTVAAKEKLGFSLENLGAPAALLIGLAVFIVAYRLLRYADMPAWTTILFSAFFALTLLHAVLPKTTADAVSKYPELILLALAGAAYGIWHIAANHAHRLEVRRPSYALERFHAIPAKKDLGKEKRAIQKRMRKPTKRDLKDERRVRSNVEKTLGLLEREGITVGTQPKLLRWVHEARTKAHALRDDTVRVRRLDDALERFDLQWLRNQRHLNADKLTEEQQRLLRQTVSRERQELNAEEHIGKLETRIGQHILEVEQGLAKAEERIRARDPVGAMGWLTKAHELERETEALTQEVAQWEKRLLRTLRQQHHDANA
jgi:hypothetical protein